MMNLKIHCSRCGNASELLHEGRCMFCWVIEQSKEADVVLDGDHADLAAMAAGCVEWVTFPDGSEGPMVKNRDGSPRALGSEILVDITETRSVATLEFSAEPQFTVHVDGHEVDFTCCRITRLGDKWIAGYGIEE